MIDWEYFLGVSWLAFLGLIIPIFGISYMLFSTNRRLAMDRRTGAKYLSSVIALSLIIFITLVFLTGGIITVFYQEVGLFLDPQALVWNVTGKLKVIIPYSTGTSLFAVAVLSGFTYAGLLIFPPVCKVDFDQDLTEVRSSNLQAATSSASTIVAGSSALASGVVCCSTSIISLISPAFATFLAPHAPFLVLLSIFLMDFNLFRQIFPRYPTKSVS